MLLDAIRHAEDRRRERATPRPGLSRSWLNGGFAGALLAVAAIVIHYERDVTTLPFVAVCASAIFGFVYLFSRRLLFSLYIAAGLMLLSTVASIAKFKWMTINAHVFDVWFYVARPETFLFLAQSFPKMLTAATLIGVVSIVGLALTWTAEMPRVNGRRRATALLLASAVAAPLTLPGNASDFNYHIEDRHFASSFFASFVDLTRLGEGNPFTLPKHKAQAFASPTQCSNLAARPDIILTLSESAVPPAQIPGWKFDAALSERFKSYDGTIRRARVETHAGGTWITYASVLSGISMADFGWKRPYATMLLRDGLHHSLAATLARCGYRTVALSPGWSRFVNEGPFLRSMGFGEYYDAKDLAAPSAQEMDAFYFGKALEIYKRHIAEDGRPLFLFVMSTVAHSPYNFRAAPHRVVAGEPFGNDAATDEFLRRLTLAQEDYAAYLDQIRQLKRPAITAQFGDHQPIITRDVFARAKPLQDIVDWNNPLYETFYAVMPIHMKPVAPLPAVPVLDLAYLGTTLLEAAGLPLDAVFADKRDLRARCKGAFHTCSDRAAVDLHLSRLRSSGLLGKVVPDADIRLGAVSVPQ